MARRAPGNDKTATARAGKRYSSYFKRGVLNGITTGAPLAMEIKKYKYKKREITEI